MFFIIGIYTLYWILFYGFPIWFVEREDVGKVLLWPLTIRVFGDKSFFPSLDSVFGFVGQIASSYKTYISGTHGSYDFFYLFIFAPIAIVIPSLIIKAVFPGYKLRYLLLFDTILAFYLILCSALFAMLQSFRNIFFL